MCLLPCHIAAGIMYRGKLALKYRSDVCSYDSLRDLHIRSNDFDSGICDCCRGEDTCNQNLFACFCTPVRFSANSSASGFVDFWVALILTSIFFPFLWTFGFAGRAHIRDEYNMTKKPLNDVCAWMWCYCCALMQESKFIDKAFIALRDGPEFMNRELQPVYIPEVIPKSSGR